MGEMSIFFDAMWNKETCKDGADFYLVDSNAFIISAGSFPMEMSGRVEMEAKALNAAMQQNSELHGRCSNIFTSSREL